MDTLNEWVSLDPAAASAAILKMPACEDRTDAVNSAAEIMCPTDPAAAVKFLRDSGETHLSCGAARAWLAFAHQTKGQPADPSAVGISPAQQESMMAPLTDLVKGSAPGTDSAGSSTMMSDDELHSLVSACPRLSPGPAKEQLIEAIFRRMGDATDYSIPVSRISREPRDYDILLVNDLERSLQGSPDDATLANIKRLGANFEALETSTHVLNIAAPRILPRLARAGHITEAVELLPRITDPAVRRTALESILPDWMDTDPTAARAAFNAAPLTALEREQWEQKPAFLLHPEPRQQ
jgi:hypothetical protein